MDIEGLEIRINKRSGITYWENGILVGRKCTKCGENKEIEEFDFQKTRGSYRADCKECHRERLRKYKENNPDKVKENHKKYRENNSDKVRERSKKYRENNSDKVRESSRKYREDNANEIKERRKKYRENNLNEIREKERKYRENNREKIREKDRKWRKNNLDKTRESCRKYRENNLDRERERSRKGAKKCYANNKEKNICYISDIVEQIRPIFKELNLPVYGYVYMFENIKTGHRYIGQSINPIKIRYKGSNIVQGWIKERKNYSNQKFVEELIEADIKVTETLDVACCQYHLDKLEAYYIDKYDSFLNGYNNNAGNHDTDDGIEEFNQILLENNLEFIDGKLVKIS